MYIHTDPDSKDATAPSLPYFTVKLSCIQMYVRLDNIIYFIHLILQQK
jgi:hypothetical protein